LCFLCLDVWILDTLALNCTSILGHLFLFSMHFNVYHLVCFKYLVFHYSMFQPNCFSWMTFSISISQPNCFWCTMIS
jgi:hypothetical protein